MTNYQFILKAFQKLYTRYISKQELPPLERETDVNVVSGIIRNLLQDDKPCMIARFGAFELATIVNYLGIQQGPQSAIKYIKGDALDWWWNEKLIRYMNTNAGFFPPTHEKLTQFCELMLHDAQQVDVLGSWQKSECYLTSYLPNSIIKVDRDNINPFFAKHSWTEALRGKNVVVIHPFAKTIKSQYERKDKVFPNGFLPDFNLIIIKAVQSIGGECTGFSTWFNALKYMEDELDKIDYDICLIGCGAYGFPLAAHAKRKGKKAIHIGGSLQLYFGIKGKRWESEGYKNTANDYSKLFNEYWVRPTLDEYPQNASKIEGGCYW